MPGGERPRPDPEQLLREVQAQELSQKRGRLKVFLGYASGVGKSLKMMDEARRRRTRGEDVIIASSQENLPVEVQSLLHHLELLPQKRSAGGLVLDVEGLLRRNPQFCVIDPLARDNPPGSRNPKRWQDVEEILRAGISVITSVNLLHIEELQTQVSAITGKQTAETVPKRFLENADEIVIVDAPLDLHLSQQGLDPGDVGISNQLERRLSELREMALVLAAEIAEKQLEAYVASHGIQPLWGIQERILVSITPRSNAAKMIASGLRNKERFHAELYVVYVRQPNLSARDQEAIDRYLDEACEAGAKVCVLQGDDPVETILDFARSNRITQLYIGHSAETGWMNRLRGDSVARLIRAAEDMDVRIFPH
jgi:two-component system sensor histidine kinase KdpD